MKKNLIFVVDDEPEILELYEGLLGEEFDVKSFGAVEDFLAALESQQPSLVVSDLKMPGLDGIGMIKKAYQDGHFFPFILLSGHLDKNAAVEAVNLGAFRILEKPTDPDLLMETIDQLLLEHEIVTVRREVRDLTSQLRELYSSIRLLMSQYIPEDVLERLVVSTDERGRVTAKMNFEDLLEKIEARLDVLLKSEKILTEMKEKKI